MGIYRGREEYKKGDLERGEIDNIEKSVGRRD